MKRLTVLSIGLLMLVGCASMNYETKDGTRVSYTRLFTSADSIEAKVGEATVKANGQKIDVTALQSLLNVLNSTK